MSDIERIADEMEARAVAGNMMDSRLKELALQLRALAQSPEPVASGRFEDWARKYDPKWNLETDWTADMARIVWRAAKASVPPAPSEAEVRDAFNKAWDEDWILNSECQEQPGPRHWFAAGFRAALLPGKGKGAGS